MKNKEEPIGSQPAFTLGIALFSTLIIAAENIHKVGSNVL